MANNADMRVRISADVRDLKAGFALVTGELAKLKSKAAMSGPNTDSWSRGLASVRGHVVGLAGAFVSLNIAGRSVRAVFDAFDRADRIEEVATILAMTTEQVSRFAFGAKQAGVELESMKTGFVIFEKNLSKNADLLKVMGVTAPDTAGKIHQIADVFAEMGDSPQRAELAMRLFGRAGADLIPLLAEGSAKLTEFAQKSDEVGFTVSGKTAAAAAAFNDKLDVMKGTLTGVASQIGAALLPQLDNAVDGLQGVASDGSTTAGVVEVLKVALELMGSVASGIGSILSGVGGFIASLGIKASDVLEPIRSLATALRDLGTLGGSVFKVLGIRIDQVRARISGNVGAGVAADRALRDFTENQRRFWGAADGTGAMLTAAQQQKDPRWRNVVGGIGETVKAATEAKAPVRDLERILEELLNPTKGKGGKGAKTKRAEEVKGIADAAALARDGVKASLELLEQMYADGQFAVEAYFAQREALQLEAIDLQIKQAQAEAATATSTDQQSRALTQVVKLQRERAAIGPQTARDQAIAEKALTDQLELLRAKLADLNGGFGNEAAAQLQDQYEALLKKLGQSAEGADLAGKIFNIESARARIDAIQSKVQEVMARLRDGTTYLAAQEQVGGIGPAEAERQLFDLRQRSLEQLRALRQAMAAYLATQAAGSPEHAAAVAGLQQLDTEIAGVQASQQTFANAARDGAIQALSGFFTDLATGAKNFTDAFKSMVLNFVQGLARMAAEALAKRIIMSLFAPTPSAKGNAFGGSGLLPGFAKGAAFALPGLMAFANGGAFTNQVFSDPTIFKFGSGDQFGVMGEAGPEAVMPLSRGADGKLGVKSSGGGAGRPQRIVLVENQRDAEAMVRGSTGEDAVIMHIERNAGKIREILGS